MRKFRFLMALALTAGAATAMAQTTRTVGTGGDFATVQAAVDASVAGDIVEVIDNTAPIVGNVAINKQITLRGAASLDPRPTLQGTNASYSGVAGQLITFEGGAASTVIENLILDGSATSIAVTSWPGSGDANVLPTLNNVRLLGPTNNAGENGATHSQTLNMWNGFTVNDCEIIGGFDQVVIEGGARPVLYQLNDCVLSKARNYAVVPRSGQAITLELNGCIISGSAQRTISMENPSGTLNISHCILRPDPDTGVGSGDGLIITQAGPMTINIDHTDFIGNPATTHNAVVLLVPMTAFSVTDCIFTNFNRYWWISNGASGDAALLAGFEDSNVYVGLANDVANCDATTPANVYPVGADSINLAADAPVYVNAAAGDYRLLQASAANWPGIGYAGSQGVSDVWVPVELSDFVLE